MLKRLLLFAALIGIPFSASHALTFKTVQLSTTGVLQAGTTGYAMHLATGTIRIFTSTAATITNTLTMPTGSTATFSGNLAGSSVTATNLSATTAVANSFTASASTVTNLNTTMFVTSSATINGNNFRATAGTQTYTIPAFGQAGNFVMSTSTGPLLIIQQVQCSVAASSSTTPAVFVNSNLTCSITPTQTSSKIRISVMGQLLSNSNNVGATTSATLARGGTNILGSSGGCVAEQMTAGTTLGAMPCSMTYLDSPASTSALTYTIQIKTLSLAGTATWCQANQTCDMLLEEIGK